MELPQPRPYGAEGRKPTHDFLSLYSHSSSTQIHHHQDPRPAHTQGSGGHLKTHDFLQPLERVSNTSTKEETEDDEIEKPLPPARPPPQPPAAQTSVEHVLPGGIGTYSISHISTFNNSHQGRALKPEGSMFTVAGAAAQATSSDQNEETSNCGSYNAGSGFTLWEEPAVKKGKTGKENIVGDRSSNVVVRESATTEVGQWAALERQSQSSSNNNRNSFGSLSSSHPSVHKSQSFMDMIKSAKGSTQDDDFDDEDDFVLKKETPSPILKGELRVKVDEKTSNDQKANTPRSKHSATEQRRRSKINDRFQMLREIIPHSDQKRDKASFLLEVIEYIQFLQVRVQKYEGPCQGWNNEPAKLVPWRSNGRSTESFIDPSRGISTGAGPPFLFAPKLDDKNIAIPGTTQTPAESDTSSATTFKGMPFPMSLQPNLFIHGAGTQFVPRLASDADNMPSLPQPNSCITKSNGPDGVVARENKIKEQDLIVEGGTISISSLYSKGLLDTLTQALQSSGVDLSQANISVQIELGKRANSAPILKEKEVPPTNHGTTRVRASSCEESGQLSKKLKMGKS